MSPETGHVGPMDDEHTIPLSKDDVRETKAMTGLQRKNWMRNKPCICNSGKKFKRCCWSKYAPKKEPNHDPNTP